MPTYDDHIDNCQQVSSRSIVSTLQADMQTNRYMFFSGGGGGEVGKFTFHYWMFTFETERGELGMVTL